MFNVRSRAVAAAVAGVLLLAPLAGCGGGGNKSSGSTSAGSISASAFIKGLLTQIDKTSTVHMNIDGGTLFSASADVRYGASTAIKMSAGLGGTKQNLILANSTMYMQQSAGGKYSKITSADPTYGSIIKAFSGLGPRQAIAGIEPGITKVLKDGTTSMDGVTLTKYKVYATTAGTTGAFKALAGTTARSKRDAPPRVPGRRRCDPSN